MSTSDHKARGSDSYHHGDLRRALIRSGRDLLHEGGRDALTLRAAAARAGVSVAAPYRHFADKEALLTAVLVDSLRDLELGLGQDTTGHPLTRLHALGHRFVDLAIAEPELFRLLASADASRGTGSELADAIGKTFESFSAAIDEAQAAGAIDADPLDALLVMRCVMHGLTGLIAQGSVPENSAHEIADRVMATIDRGLLPRVR